MQHISQIKRIDNVFFEVTDLKKAASFYANLGFQQKMEIAQMKAILFNIGEEEPGLILCEKKIASPSRFWVETPDSREIKETFISKKIPFKEIETATGIILEVTDESSNVIGFVDYSKNRKLARTNDAIAITYAKRIWEIKDLNAIDELLHPDCLIHSSLGDFFGSHHMKPVVQAWLISFPDLKVKNTAMICKKDLVMIQWEAKGTHQGIFKGLEPLGKPVSYSGVTLYRISHDKIIEYWAYLDLQSILNQIR